jgi:tetratricopeptide (TPR) repeat protein
MSIAQPPTKLPQAKPPDRSGSHTLIQPYRASLATRPLSTIRKKENALWLQKMWIRSVPRTRAGTSAALLAWSVKQLTAAFALQLLKAELALRRDSKEAEPAMRDVLLKAKEGFHSADATGSLFLIQLAADDCRNLKKWDLAQFAAEQMLGFDANYAGGHYEMGMVRLQAGQMDAARTEFGKAIELWKNADPDLVELLQAKQQLAALGVAQK